MPAPARQSARRQGAVRGAQRTGQGARGRTSRPAALAGTGRPGNRAAIVDRELRRLAYRIEADFFSVCELVQEAIDGAYYATYGFPDAQRYLEDRLGLSYRSVRRRLAVLEAVRTLPSKDQDEAKNELAAVGGHKAAALAPAIRKDPEGWREWVRIAATETVDAVQGRVSRVLGLRPRGPAAQVSEQVGEGWYRAVLAGLPDDLREQTQRAFKLAELPLEKADPNPYECWGALVAEFIATWEPKAATS